MPKVVVYVKVDDARVIAATEGREIDAWVRSTVREQIAHWYSKRQGSNVHVLPQPWMRQEEEGA